MKEQWEIACHNKLTVGVDEVGRGPIAGPVVAAAVILNKSIPGLNDSKKLSEKKRNEFAQLIRYHAVTYSIARVSHQKIDEINIFQATLLAMKLAIEGLSLKPEYGLIDGTHVPQVDFPCQALVKGDSRVASISAASILAKVSRDEEMIELEKVYPGYGFAQHKGYPTKQHLQALDKLGVCPIHRRSFAPVKLRADILAAE